MTVYKGLVKVETLAGKPTYVDVPREVADIVSQSGIKEGVVHCISCHTTCAVYSQEFDHDVTPAGDTFMQADLSDGLDRSSRSSTTGRRTGIPDSANFRGSRELAKCGGLSPRGRPYPTLER